MKAARVGKFIRPGSAVYMAAVIEYLLAEVLELAGNCARDNKRKSIKPRHIMMAVEMDDELKPLFGGANVILPGGGVVPGIHSCLGALDFILALLSAGATGAEHLQGVEPTE